MSPDPGLTPFSPEHADAVLACVRSRDELDAWCSRSDFPPDRAVFDEWHADPDVCAFVLVERAGLVAYGEIWQDVAQREAELARIIVSPEHRRRGLGRRFVGLLAEEARRHGSETVWVRVVPTNGPALACYGSAGFRRADAEMEQVFNRRQPRVYVWMSRNAAGGA